MQKHFSFWIGFFVALMLAVPVAVGAWGATQDWARNVAVFTLGLVVGLVVLAMLVLLFRERLLRRFVGTTDTTLDGIVTKAFDVVSETVAGNRQNAVAASSDLTRQITSWYLWTSFYRWVIGTCVALLVGFGAFAGTVLLFEQNEKLEKQNGLLNQQTEQLTEQNRRYDIENALSGLSLVSELRQRLESAGRLPIQEIALVFPGGPCSLRYSESEFDLPANPSEVEAVKMLATSGVLADQVRAALRNLQRDNSSAVRLAASQILDELEANESNAIVLINGLYLPQEVNFSEEGRGIHIRQSFVRFIGCEDCYLSISDSVVYTSAERFGTIESSILLPSSDAKNQFPFMSQNGPELIDSNTRSVSNSLLMGRWENDSDESYVVPLPATGIGMFGVILGRLYT